MKCWTAVLISSLLLALVACSGEEGLADGSVELHQSRLGLVSVTYDHRWTDVHDAAQLTATAQFVRYSAMDHEQVARLLALPLDPQRDLPALDQCRRYDLSLDLAAHTALETEEQGYVELLEAGDLKIEAQGSTVTLMPRHFPGLLPFISGVVYGEAQAALINRGSHVVSSSSTGGEAVGAFSARLNSPQLPRLSAVAGAASRSLVTLPRGSALPLRWHPSATPGATEVTYLELRYNAGGTRHEALRCRLLDDGQFEVPRSLMAGLAGKVTLNLTRLQQGSFVASGLDHGELRVVVRDTAALVVQ